MLACFSLRENVFISGGSSLVPQLFSLGWPVTVFETVVVVVLVAVLTVVTYDQGSQSDKNCEENESHKSQHTLAEFEIAAVAAVWNGTMPCFARFLALSQPRAHCLLHLL